LRGCTPITLDTLDISRCGLQLWWQGQGPVFKARHFFDIRSDQAEGKTEEENDDDCMVLEQEQEEEGGNKQPSPVKPDQKADTEKNKPEELLHQASFPFAKRFLDDF
jgi:hypothetical protein